MKIAHLIYTLDSGGAEAALYRLLSANMTNEHIIITIADGGKYKLLLDNIGIHTLSLKKNGGALGWFFAAFRLIKILRTIRADVLQTWMYHSDFLGGVCARIVGLNRVFWGVHHFNLSEDITPKSTIFLAKLCAGFSKIIPHKIVFCSYASAKAHYEIGYSIVKGIVIQNGYDLSEFYPSLEKRLRTRLHILSSRDVFLIGMVARFDPQKDHSNLLQALYLLKANQFNFHCILVGKEVDKHNLKLTTMINQLALDDQISLLGECDDIPSIMNALDLHVLSSLGEAFPNVLCESMACETPCVTTDVGDASKIVRESGWVVPPGDSTKLLEAIQIAIQESNGKTASWSERKSLSRRIILDNYNIARMVSNYNTAWSDFAE